MSALVDTAWLEARLDATKIRILDVTWFMPGERRDAWAEYQEGHIPGALYFDIERQADSLSGLPHMLPRADAFAHAVADLGVDSRSTVIVYDRSGIRSAARLWWMFRCFGHDSVAVLDGGFQRWAQEGRRVESRVSTPPRGDFEATARPGLVRTFEDMMSNLAHPAEQVIDARSRGRFSGREPEPRAGLRGGHIPSSINLPYDHLLDPRGCLLPQDELRRRFAAAGVDPERPIVTTCGSGVTACVLALGLHEAGRAAAVYDGSWAEWGSRPEAPVAITD